MALKLLDPGYATIFHSERSGIGESPAMIHMSSFLPPETVEMLPSELSFPISWHLIPK